MKRLRIATIGAGAAILILTLVIGGTAFAQTESGPGDSLGESFLDRLAENLGISRGELDDTIQQSGNEVIDDAVADGRLSEERAEILRQRLESGAPFMGFAGPHGPGGPHHGRNVLGFSLPVIGEELGMTVDELRAELADGATLSDVITTQGSSVEAVVDALVSEAEAKLDEAVANGRLSQERADEILANLPERLTERIENGPIGPWCNERAPAVDDADGDESGDSEETSV